MTDATERSTGKSESSVQSAILRGLGNGDTRLFRNNVGQAWVGNAARFSNAGTVIVSPGDVLLRNARPLHAGLCAGSSDLIGWRTITITPEMVGQRVAVFVAIEVKSDRGRATEDQAAFLRAVAAAGGMGGVARSVEDAEGIVGRGQAGIG